ncbi:PQQ-dependent sugar dehydrogenase [Conyzicola sp.]|uniref:PQQ-dependent sugar dehydrogenase n=1 Tax=Conyzicola sp. TaxID=1969404 RepID=UPI003989CF5A
MIRWMRVVATAGAVALLAACASGGTPEPVPTPSAPPSSSPSPSPTPEPLALPVGEPTVVAQGFTTPWSVARLASGSSLVSERDTALVKEVTATGEVRVVGTVDGVQPGGEGGLLGLAVSPWAAARSEAAFEAQAATEPLWLYAYFTAAGDNRIVRFALDGSAGSYTLGAREDVLTGIAKAGNHNGGRIAFGPDGMLYATTGDAGNRAASQDPASLNGKILRMSPTGQVPADNPAAGSHVYSLGHRNPQGIAWDGSGQLWAAEFGQNTWDELNVIRPGADYGWPTVEGVASDPAFVNPVYQWATDEASPSGLAFTRGAFYLAALKGERLWSVTTDTGAVATPWFAGVFGRIRDVAPGPNGTLWMLTSNTDGRGDPRAGDDKLLQVALETAGPG